MDPKSEERKKTFKTSIFLYFLFAKSLNPILQKEEKNMLQNYVNSKKKNS